MVGVVSARVVGCLRLVRIGVAAVGLLGFALRLVLLLLLLLSGALLLEGPSCYCLVLYRMLVVLGMLRCLIVALILAVVLQAKNLR